MESRVAAFGWVLEITKKSPEELTRSDLEKCIGLYNYYGGSPCRALKDLGYISEENQMKHRPRNYWTNKENFEREVMQAIRKNKGELPSWRELNEQGRTDLLNAMRKYYGGIKAVREKYVPLVASEHIIELFPKLNIKTGGQYVVRNDDIKGLNILNETYQIKTVYYPGSGTDVSPLLLLDAKTYYYQDLEELYSRMDIIFDGLEKEEFVENIKKRYHIGSKTSAKEISFIVDNKPKKLYLFQKSDVRKKLIPQIKEADLIYGLASLVTDEMLEKAKNGCLILNRIGLGLDEYEITKEQEKKYNLKKVIFPKVSIFEWSNFYRKGAA